MGKYFYNNIKNYTLRNMSSFHTPGHKGNKVFDMDLWKFDLTELPDTDSLYEACAAILKSELSAQKLFGTQRTLISAGGNTLCIQSMIRLASLSKKTFISGRNIHRSAVSAMALLGIQPKWVLPSKDTDKGETSSRIKSEDIARLLNESSGGCAVYITSPDYYGVISDIKSISNECKKRDSFVIVDNAHGTHLKFCGKSLHPTEMGAVMSADSAHKTLPVLTGGAWLHIMDESFISNAKQAMALFGSTSPSYLIMTSLDACADYLECRGCEDFSVLEKKVESIKEIAKYKGICVTQGLCDPVRITLVTPCVGYSGYEFAMYLRNCGIEPEFFDENCVVLIPSPFNVPDDWSRLEDALLNFKEKDKKEEKCTLYSYLPEVKITLREALMAECVKVGIEDASGRTAGEIACPCPPGIPVVMPGEVIGEHEKQLLKNYGISYICVVK